jgi:16S rRNA (cytosine1407-C5)-methyltransferase
LAVRQERLLVSAFQAVKPGGQIVYSTCTLAPEEDEGVVDGLLKRFAGSVEVVDVSRKLTAGANGLISEGVKDFDAALHNSVRLWPHIYGTSGFFAVRLTKLNPVGVDLQPAPSRQLARTGLVELSSKEITLLGSRFLQLYGFDLRSTLEEQELSLWKRGSAVFTLPEAFLRRFADLPFEAVGLLLGEESGDGFELSHEWVARYSYKFSSGFYILPEENVPAWLHGEDIRGMPFNGYPASSLVVVVDQSRRLLGRGKIQTQRLKNLLPRRLV